MRKRLVMGAIAAVVIGIAAYMLSQPKKGTVEWHKSGYLAAVDVRWKQRWESLRSRVMREDGQRGIRFDVEGMKHHESALLRLGFLERRELTVSNRDPLIIMLQISGWCRSSNSAFFRYTIPAPNRVEWVAVSGDMPTWEELIRKADVPESR